MLGMRRAQTPSREWAPRHTITCLTVVLALSGAFISPGAAAEDLDAASETVSVSELGQASLGPDTGEATPVEDPELTPDAEVPEAADPDGVDELTPPATETPHSPMQSDDGQAQADYGVEGSAAALLAVTNGDAPSYQCEAGVIYSLSNNGRVQKVQFDANDVATVTTLEGWRSGEADDVLGTGNFNGLAMTPDGSTMYAYQTARVNGRLSIVRFVQAHSDGSNWVFSVAREESFQPPLEDIDYYFYFLTGAVNPVTGHFVFGGYTTTASDGMVFRVYDYDPSTGDVSALGFFKTGETAWPAGNAINSDLAFDTSGNMYVLESWPGVSPQQTRIHTVTADSLSAANGLEISASHTEFIVTNLTGIVGLAFGADGAAYLSDTRNLYRYNPATWELLRKFTTILGSWSQSHTWSADLASCGSPSTLIIQKNVIGRGYDTDQFKLYAALESTGTKFAFATTTGTETGIQDQQIGPFPVYSNSTVSYSFGETGAETSTEDLTGYTASWECTEKSDETFYESGDGTDGSVLFNPIGLNITCVITNEPVPGEVGWTKTDSVTGEQLAGSEWTITGPGFGEGALVEDCTAAECAGLDKDPVAGQFRLAALEWGEYSLQEKTAPAGFVRSTEVRVFVVGPDSGDEVKLVWDLEAIGNQRVLGAVIWEKVDSSSPAAHLVGSQWRIVGPNPETTELIVTDCVADDAEGCATQADTDQRAGHFKVTGLAWGSYELVEVTAPGGYLLLKDSLPFEIGRGSLEVSLGAIENVPIVSPELPLAGGTGSHAFLIGGFGLVIFGLALAGSNIRSRRRVVG